MKNTLRYTQYPCNSIYMLRGLTFSYLSLYLLKELSVNKIKYAISIKQSSMNTTLVADTILDFKFKPMPLVPLLHGNYRDS